MLVYDITVRESFQRVQLWVAELKKFVGEDIILTIVGNKIDRKQERTVSEEEAERYD